MIPEKTQIKVDRVIGQRLEGYEVLEQIGEGKTGTIYRAYHQVQEQYAAIKVFKPEAVPDEETARRVFEEARASTAIGAEGIVKVFGFGRLSDGRYYWAREYLEGDSLDWVLRNRALPESIALEVLDQVAAALSAAHAWQMVHRHLKPSNVFLVNQRDSRIKVKVLDFGLAKPGATPLTDLRDLYELARELGASAVIENDAAKQPTTVEPIRTRIAELKGQAEDPSKNVTDRPHPALTTLSGIGPGQPRPKAKPRWVVPVLVGAALAGVVTAVLFVLQPPADELAQPLAAPPQPPARPSALPKGPIEIEGGPDDEPQAPEVRRQPSPPAGGGVRSPKGPAPSEEALRERVERLKARLRKKPKGWTDDPEQAYHVLHKQELRLTESPDADERREIARQLDGWEKSYLAR